MPKQLAKDTTHHRPGLDRSGEDNGQCGAQFAVQDIHEMPNCIEFCEDDQHKSQPPFGQQLRVGHEAQNASSINAKIDRSTYSRSTSTSGAAVSNATSQFSARQWHVARKTSLEGTLIPKMAGTQLPLTGWQLENKEEQPWNNIAAFAIEDDVKATSAPSTEPTSMLTEISIGTDTRRNVIQDKNQKSQKCDKSQSVSKGSLISGFA